MRNIRIIHYICINVINLKKGTKPCRKKNYSRQEETTYHSSVNEPQASYGLSVNDLRTELIREVLHIEDKFLLHEALNYFKNLTLTNTNKQACKAEEQEWWTLISKEER